MASRIRFVGMYHPIMRIYRECKMEKVSRWVILDSGLERLSRVYYRSPCLFSQNLISGMESLVPVISCGDAWFCSVALFVLNVGHLIGRMETFRMFEEIFSSASAYIVLW